MRELWVMFLVRREYFNKDNDKLKTCYDPDYNTINFTARVDCEQMCKVKCNFKYYPFKVVRYTTKDPKLYLDHSVHPDIFYKHVPEMNLICFISNIGRMFGMWLGLFYLGNKVIEVKQTIYSFSINVDRQVKSHAVNLTIAEPIVTKW